MSSFLGLSSKKEQKTAPWLEKWIDLAKFEQTIKILNENNQITTFKDFKISDLINNNEVYLSMLNEMILRLKMINLQININDEESSSEDSSDEESDDEKSVIHRALSLALHNSQ